MIAQSLTRQFTFGLLLLSAVSSFGQIKFEKGYFIDQEGRRTECLIKNIDWQNNPDGFSYQTAADGTVEQAGIATVREFGIYDAFKFIRAEVGIDRSSDDLNDLGSKRNPTFQQEQLFLKVVVEGKANLYAYKGENLVRFFYSIDAGPIEQLVYRRYFSSGSNIAVNSAFQQQLLNEVNCPDISSSAINSLNYRETALKRHFLKYNACVGSTSEVFEVKAERNVFNLKIAPGFTSSMVYLYFSGASADAIDLGSGSSFRFGMEMEYILPFNKNKWGILLEPTFQYFNVQSEVDAQTTAFKHNYLEIPAGLRYYLFLKGGQKLFINGFYVSNIALKSMATTPLFPFGIDLNLINLSSFAVGGGMEFGKFSVELRYYTDRNLVASGQIWNADMTRLSLIAGYKLVNAKSKPFQL